MTKGLYEQELQELSWLLNKLSISEDMDHLSISEDTTIPITVERGEHGKATLAGVVVYDGVWTFVAMGP